MDHDELIRELATAYEVTAQIHRELAEDALSRRQPAIAQRYWECSETWWRMGQDTRKELGA